MSSAGNGKKTEMFRSIVIDLIEDEIRPRLTNAESRRITVMVRMDGEPEQDILITDDSIDGISELVKRSRKREAV